MKRRAGWKIWVIVILMLLAIWAYVASLDESEPLNESLPGLSPATGP